MQLEEVALGSNFLFEKMAKVALRTKVLKICGALIAQRFCIFFWLIAQFYTLNLILLHLNRNFDKYRPSVANYLLSFSLKSQKMWYLHCVVKFHLRKLGCALTWYKNAVQQLRSCVALQLNQEVHCRSCAALQTLKKRYCAFVAVLLLVEKMVALCCAVLLV